MEYIPPPPSPPADVRSAEEPNALSRGFLDTTATQWQKSKLQIDPKTGLSTVVLEDILRDIRKMPPEAQPYLQELLTRPFSYFVEEDPTAEMGKPAPAIHVDFSTTRAIALGILFL